MRQTLEPVILRIADFKCFGTPAQVAETLIALHAAGVDGVQMEFWRPTEDIGYFADHVLPLLQQAGLRDFA